VSLSTLGDSPAAGPASIGIAAGALGDHVAKGVLASAAVAADAAALEGVDAFGASLDGGSNLTVGKDRNGLLRSGAN